MGKPKAPPAPDYSGIAAANSEAAKYNFELGKEQLAWAKEQYASDKETTGKVVDQMLTTQQANDATAAADRKRYEQVYQPLEDQYVAQAKDLASPERADANAARAATDVSQNFNQARENAKQALVSYGVDPSQTRSAALDLNSRTQEGAARAGAANTARLQTTVAGQAGLGAAVDVGKGYPAQIAQQYGVGTQAGSGAVNSNATTTGTGASTMGTPTQYQGLGFQGLSGWSNALTSGYNAQMQRYDAQQKSSSGIGSILGTVAGIGLKSAFFAEGGEVPDQNEMVGHEGVPVTKEMSPSRGVNIDDIPARLNAGEFVVPEDTVKWFGEKHMQDMIRKGREERAKRHARPTVRAVDMNDSAARPRGVQMG